MNAHPNKLVEELDRILMERWFNRIPNRRYTHRSPAVTGQQGKFSAEIFEETQPRPQPDRIAAGIGHALATPQFFWLTCLTGLAMLLLIVGAIAAILASRHMLAGTPFVTTIAFGISQIAVGMFCYGAAHILWGRFDFVSELIWVDINGSYEAANVNLGNQLSGNVQTSKNVINIESMTMRVWVSEIDTVIFGKDAPRQMTGMRGLQTVADDLAGMLKNFGETRSMVVAPTSVQDLERAQQVGAMSQMLAGSHAGTSSETTAGLLTAALSAMTPGAPAAPANVLAGPGTQRYCAQCGAPAAQDAKFCAECGKSLSA
jgi:hypothetical protein